MQTHDDILDLLQAKGAEAARNMLRGLIIQPGAIGDCILTLPLAAYVKDRLGLGGVDILGHTEYVGFLPGRSCVDGVRSIDALELNRMFAETRAFELKDRDSLIDAFSDYSWIITFMGGPESSFEQNLIYTANCSHSAEVITLSIKPHQENAERVSGFYIRQFVERSGSFDQSREIETDACLIEATPTDVTTGRKLLNEAGLDGRRKLVVIQPGSGGKEKCWYVGNFLAVAAGLASKGFEVVFLLGPAERERFSEATIRRINSVAPCLTDLSLTDVVALLSCAEVFVGNDSGITHLAGAMGVRTAVVFGPTDPAIYKPVGPHVSAFAAGVAGFADRPSTGLQKEVLDALTA
ncbi:MAG: glycosyltransferase family 9 protein [Phycisphaerales bacterium]|nr:MAG: glycosyltransferase family 9 protein [Phycisphaerales bacterium]